MKVKFVCDCCDNVFDEVEVDENDDRVDLSSLTGEERQDIILQDQGDSELCISSTCQDCMQELDEYDPEEGSFRFYKAPLLN